MRTDSFALISWLKNQSAEFDNFQENNSLMRHHQHTDKFQLQTAALDKAVDQLIITTECSNTSSSAYRKAGVFRILNPPCC
jgi:hypothetical protein